MHMPDGKQRMHKQHPWSRILHHFTDFLLHLLRITVHLTGTAERLRLHKRAFFRAKIGVRLQLAARLAEFSPLRPVHSAAVDADHAIHGLFLPRTLLFYLLRRHFLHSLVLTSLL